MRIIKYPAEVNGNPRPCLYVGDDTAGSVLKDVIASLKEQQKGAIFSSPYTRETQRWRYMASWTSDVVAFWFDAEPLQAIRMLDLGVQLGRYCSRGGAKRIIIGADPRGMYVDDLKAYIETVNYGLANTWKLYLITDFEEFLSKIKKVLS